MIVMSMFIDKDNISTNVDTWWQFLQAIEYLTEKHKKMIAYLICKVLEKTILDYCPQNTKAGGMTQTSSIESKPESLVKEFKYILYAAKGILPYLEIKRGKFNELPLLYRNPNITTYFSLHLNSTARSCSQTGN